MIKLLVIVLLLSVVTVYSVNFTNLSWSYSDVGVLANSFLVRPAFKLFYNQDQSFSGGVETRVWYDTPVLDNAGGFNTNFYYVIPVSGIYAFEASIGEYSEFPNDCPQFKIRENNSAFAWGNRIAHGDTPSTNVHTSVRGMLSTTSGAIVDVSVTYDSSQGNPITGNVEAVMFFQGHFITP